MPVVPQLLLVLVTVRSPESGPWAVTLQVPCLARQRTKAPTHMPQHLSVQGLALQDVPSGVSADAPGFRAWVRVGVRISSLNKPQGFPSIPFLVPPSHDKTEPHARPHLLAAFWLT